MQIGRPSIKAGFLTLHCQVTVSETQAVEQAEQVNRCKVESADHVRNFVFEVRSRAGY